MEKKIGFIGCGNMGKAILGGLIASGQVLPGQIWVYTPSPDKVAALHDQFGINAAESAQEVAQIADIVFAAVKPGIMIKVLSEITSSLNKETLVVSIAAGITSAQLQRWLGGDLAVVRAMPNTPALLGAGVTGLFATPSVDMQQHARAEQVLASAGRTVWIDSEGLMDSVTAVSGSGPAYVFLLAEAMEAAGIAQGLPADAARTLVVQTLLGASRMLDEAGESPAELRRRVTSPNGTTQAAIESFQAGGFEALVDTALRAAQVRGQELSAAND